jgi:ABC-type lipoprotein export system ATPase subunit
MKNLEYQIGSTWKKWDLHIHPPETKLANSYLDPTSNIWDSYIDILEKSDVQAFGITDYFSCDGYFTLIEKYREKYPDTKKVFFLNIEFRLSEVIGKNGNNPDLHVIFDNDNKLCPKSKIQKFLINLKTHESDSSGVDIACSDLKTESDFNSATVSIKDVKKALKETFGDDKSYLIIFPAKNDGIKSTDIKSPRKISISDEIDKACDAFFGSHDSTDYFLNEDRYEGSAKSEPKPVYSGSDAHSFEDLERLTGDVPNFLSTWIKGDLTFAGLKQTLFEPEARVFIGDKPEVLNRKKKESTKFISSLGINKIAGYNGKNGEWFDNVKIAFNPELTAIIGNKGSGKSAIADIIGLLGETKQSDHFSFLTNKSGKKRFKQSGFAENFDATLIWENEGKSNKNLDDSVDRTKPELVKYLPQNYFEQLTNDIEIRAFQKEIESVVFSHVETSNRMGKSTFEDLEEFKTAESKNTISDLKTRLRELHIKLIAKEKSVKPESLKLLNEQLKIKEDEVKALIKSLPDEVTKPDKETDEQKSISKAISHDNEILDSLKLKYGTAIGSLASHKSQLQELTSIEQRISGLESKVQTEKSELKEICTTLGLDVDILIKFNKDTSSISEKITEVQKQITMLENDGQLEFKSEFDYESLVSSKDILKAQEFLQSKLKKLKERLSAPQKRYQNYLHKKNEINTQIASVEGDEVQPALGTVQYYKQQIKYISEHVPAEILILKNEQKDLVKKIFESKKVVLGFYEELKNSVETKLGIINEKDFKVSIQASFVLAANFEKNFFEFIDQARKGPFKGKEDGKHALEQSIEDVDWNNIESIYAALDGILNEISSQGEIDEQLNSTKEFYDFLFSLEYFVPKYELRLGDKNLNQLSPGEKGLLLLVFYLYLDKDNIPLIIDQPEDNLDNASIFKVLAKCIREAKKSRQVILVTHNPNLAVGADAEQILYVELEKHKNYKFLHYSGAIEQPKTNANVVKILEGSRPAFVQRRLKYQI